MNRVALQRFFKIPLGLPLRERNGAVMLRVMGLCTPRFIITSKVGPCLLYLEVDESSTLLYTCWFQIHFNIIWIYALVSRIYLYTF